MGMTIRVSLPGYNALTDGTIDHYSLYADTNNVLIKEKARGVGTIANGASGTISHALGYIPFFLVYSQVSSSRYRIANSYNPAFDASGWRAYSNTASLIIDNDYGTAGTISKYYIFHDSVGAAV